MIKRSYEEIVEFFGFPENAVYEFTIHGKSNSPLEINLKCLMVVPNLKPKNDDKLIRPYW